MYLFILFNAFKQKTKNKKIYSVRTRSSVVLGLKSPQDEISVALLIWKYWKWVPWGAFCVSLFIFYIFLSMRVLLFIFHKRLALLSHPIITNEPHSLFLRNLCPTSMLGVTSEEDRQCVEHRWLFQLIPFALISFPLPLCPWISKILPQLEPMNLQFIFGHKSLTLVG